MPFIYPNNYAVQQIEPELIARQKEGRVGLEIMPMENVNAGEVRWIQKDSSYGLQQFRGMNGEPTRVQRVGEKAYTYEPGVYGEFEVVDEAELTKRAGIFPTDSTPIPVGDIVAEIDDQLLGRQFDRAEYNVWQILGTGTLTLSKPGPNNTVISQTDTYPIQQITAGTPFSTTATATPIAVFQTAQQQHLGRSVDFGAGATAYANQFTINNILNNANAADFGGRRTQYGATINNLGSLASYWQAQNLPRLVAYDEGYYPTLIGAASPGATNFQKFIPNGKIIIIGKRPGNAPIGKYFLTRNANNPGSAPGMYRYIVDRANGTNGEKRTPANIEVHRGHNGGPALMLPSAVLVLNV